MLNPTCPQCHTPIAARDAMLVMGQVAIWLQCDNGHDVVEIVPVSRFNPSITSEGYKELLEENQVSWLNFLAIGKGNITDFDTQEFQRWEQTNAIVNLYADMWYQEHIL